MQRATTVLGVRRQRYCCYISARRDVGNYQTNYIYLAISSILHLLQARTEAAGLL